MATMTAVMLRRRPSDHTRYRMSLAETKNMRLGTKETGTRVNRLLPSPPLLLFLICAFAFSEVRRNGSRLHNIHDRRWQPRLSFFPTCAALQLDDNSNKKNNHEWSRRRLLSIATTATAASTSSLLFVPPQAANAAKGAAELDFEFYMRDLIGGNKKEGNIRSSALPVMPSPRTIRPLGTTLLLDNDCSANCVATQALLSVLVASKEQDGSDVAASAALRAETANTIAVGMKQYRDRVAKSFYARAPWSVEDVSDQYYFDLTSYALWRTAADLLPNYTDRDVFARRIGQLALQSLLGNGSISKASADKSRILQGTVPGLFQILNAFQTCGYCKGFKIAGEATKDSDGTSDVVFDELDDDSLLSGTTVDCLVSIYEPATLGACLQITGEQSRFSPEYIGTTLAAYWEMVGRANGCRIASSWETFFIDPEYRPNPKDYFPNEKLLQITLRKK